MQNDQEHFMFRLEKSEDKIAIYSQICDYLTCLKELWGGNLQGKHSCDIYSCQDLETAQVPISR